MIAWVLQTARDTGLFDHVIVSTDDDEIASIAKSLGAEVPFKRPKKLSDDYADTIDVIKHALEWAQVNIGKVNYICTIYATAPFIKVLDLKNSYEKLKESDAEIIFSATSYPYPIQRAIKISKNGRSQMFQPEYIMTRSQDLESLS